MSHTNWYTIEGKSVRLIGNGDWSGDVNIRYQNGDGEMVEAVLPGELLLELGRQVAIDHLHEELGNFLDGWRGRGQ